MTNLGMNCARISIVSILLVASLAAVFGSFYPHYQEANAPKTTFPYLNSTSIITLKDFALCAMNCTYPSPYLSGIVRVQSNVFPIVNFHLFINGTDEGTIPAPTVTITATSGAVYAILFKAQPSNLNMPIKAGNSYWITLVANFTDNTNSSASIMVIAS